MIAFAKFYIITEVLSIAGTGTSVVIMENLANDVPLEQFFKEWGLGLIAFVRFYIIRADAPMYERTAVIM